MNRRILAVVCLMALAFAGCGTGDSTGSTGVETILPPQEDTILLCPWDYDVCAQAEGEEKLHYYFMSSEGQVISEDNEIADKWGDCCLIVFPNGQTMLIDCGVAGFGPLLVENLQRMGVKKLNYIVITHPHSDHQDGIFHADNLTGAGVLDRFEIGQVYHIGGTVSDSSGDGCVEAACTQYGLSLEVLEMGDELQIGPVRAKVLWPKTGTSEKEISGTANLNNSSIVIRFDYGEHSSLFTGDLYEDGEFAMMSSHNTDVFDVDFLKAPHHGGHTSGSVVFLNMVSAKLAVATGYISIRDDAARRYAQSNTPLVNDRDYGYIHVSSDGKEMVWESSRQEPLPTEACRP